MAKAYNIHNMKTIGVGEDVELMDFGYCEWAWFDGIDNNCVFPK